MRGCRASIVSMVVKSLTKVPSPVLGLDEPEDLQLLDGGPDGHAAHAEVGAKRRRLYLL
jgi:hypothetical protein